MRNGRSDQWSVVSGQKDHSRRPAHLPTTDHRPLTTGFTVTELLVVIGIIVLAMALAVPALNLITGNKSTEAATNQISAMLARARDDAIGLQQVRGVMFYYDQAEDRVNVALVQEAQPASTLPAILGDVYLDLVADSDHLALPKGVGLQTVDDAGGGTYPANDRYIGFNTKNSNPNPKGPSGPTVIPYGGVILFDSHGQLVSKSYVLQVQHVNPTVTATYTDGYWEYTKLGILLYGTLDPTLQSRHAEPPHSGDLPLPAPFDIVPVDPTIAINVTNGLILRSQVGFVLFDQEAFNNQGFTPQDSQIDSVDPAPLGAGLYNLGSNEYNEENWLDANAVPYLVNRYNGTLVKGE